MLLIYALHDSRIKKRRRRRQLWRSILESGFLSFKVSPPVLSKVPFVFLSVPHWSRKLQKYCNTCNAMQNVSFAWTYFRNRVYWRVNRSWRITTTPNTTKFFLSISNLYSNLIWSFWVASRRKIKIWMRGKKVQFITEKGGLWGFLAWKRNFQ